MTRPINIAISPNLESDDFFLALKTLFSRPDNNAPAKVASWFKNYYGQNYQAFTYNSGRSALYSILKALEIGEGDEIIVQAFTCSAAIQPILWCYAKPIYADIDKNTFNLDPQKAAQKITSRTRAIIVQHSFGQPADLAAFTRLCHQKNILLIEDCALSLGATNQVRPVGTVGSFGDVAYFSFGRDKVVSSVFGGAAITKNKTLGRKLKILNQNLRQSPKLWVTQQLLHPLITGLALPIYNLFSLGKLIIAASKAFGLLSSVYPEKSPQIRPPLFPSQLSPQLATLALNQLQKLDRFNSHRQSIANLYFQKLKSNKKISLPPQNKDSIYLRFTIQTPQAQRLFRQAQKQGILLGSWYSGLISGAESDLERIGYKLGSCPIAETVSQAILNLPTYPLLTTNQAKRVAQKINIWLQ